MPSSLQILASRARNGFASIQESPRQLHVVFLLKVLESYNYFSLSRVLTLYLTEEFGIGDVRAGTLYGAWGTLLTAYGLLLGGAIDWLGIRKSLILCFVLNITSRTIMAMTNTPWLLLVMLLGPNTVAGALGVPVMTIAVKRYTTEANRGFAFSLFYTLMNVAALSQGLLLDSFRIGWKNGFDIPSLGPHHLLNNGTRLFLFSGCMTSSIGLILALYYLANEGRDNGVATKDRSSSGSNLNCWSEIWQSTKDVCSSREFAKYMAMCLFTVNLKSLFRHLDATLPKYQLRAFGPTAPIGAIYSINPAIIVLCVPIVGALTTSYAHFDMIHLGSYVSSISPLFIAIFGTLWSTAAFVAILSVGEAIWSPRWYDYSMSVAPDGKEGIFTALSSAPLFAAMLPTGMVSGALLANYCPAEQVDCDGRTLFGILFLIAASTPLLITATQRWVRPRGAATYRRLMSGEPEVDVNEADPAAVLEHLVVDGCNGGVSEGAAGGSADR